MSAVDATSSSQGGSSSTASVTTGTLGDTTEASVDVTGVWTDSDGLTSMTSTSSTTSLDTETSADTGMLAPLDDAALVVRYYLDEVAQGQPRGGVLDAASDALDLEHDWDPLLGYVEGHDANRGLQWQEAGAHGGPFAAVRDTKVEDALAGQTEATIEIVADVRDGMPDFSARIFMIGHGVADARLAFLVSHNPPRPYFRWRGSQDAAYWEVDFAATGRAVFHVVLETTAAQADDRLRLYVDGVRATVADDEVSWPEHEEAINFAESSTLVLGNRVPGTGMRSFEGTLYYAALYAAALDEAQIAHHVSVLGHDDTPSPG
jgi:hypothetical protein